MSINKLAKYLLATTFAYVPLTTAESSESIIPVTLCTPSTLPDILKEKSPQTQMWIEQNQFEAAPSSLLILPDETGKISEVLWGQDESMWQFATLATKLPKGTYRITDWYHNPPHLACLAWSLSFYQFDKYKKQQNKPAATLLLPESIDKKWLDTTCEAITLVRDLINTPAADLTPEALATITRELTAQFNPDLTITQGNQLEQEFPAIHTVGKAASNEPCLIELRWSPPNALKSIAIVGKGVCFDSGGLDLKPSSGMLTMKKDMGGAAHALALAYMIMKMELPIAIHLVIPAVENAVSGNAMHPLDIIKTRKGLTVEIGNTDAEGRLILADALYKACEDNPGFIIDFATLTGAARVALGPDLPALFSNNPAITTALVNAGTETQDPLWPMPLHKPYEKQIKSSNADLSNTGKSPYGGAITAALFLQHFIEPNTDWVHIDLMAWNSTPTPGKPEGGEAMGLLATFKFLSELT